MNITFFRSDSSRKTRGLLGGGVIGALVASLLPVAGRAVPAPTPTPVPAAAFEQAWAALAAAARKEGQIVLSAGRTGPEWLPAVMAEFERQFGVKAKVDRGSGSKQVDRLLAERRAGVYAVDVLMASLGNFRERLEPAGALMPIKDLLFHPEVVDKSLWRDGIHRYADKKQRYAFMLAGRGNPPDVAVNTKLVQYGELQSHWDLLNPKWKGKIVAFHPIGGHSRSNRAFVYSSKELGEKYVRRFFVEMEPFLVTTTREMVDGVAAGAFAIAVLLGPAERELVAMQREGLPVRMLESGEAPQMEREYNRVSAGSNGTIGILTQAPHPNAAKLFVNWFLTKEGQTWFQKSFGDLESYRADITNEAIAPPRRMPKGPLDVWDAHPDATKRSKIATKFYHALMLELKR